MNEQWLALAKKIADLERQVQELTRERDELKAMGNFHYAQRRVLRTNKWSKQA